MFSSIQQEPKNYDHEHQSQGGTKEQQGLLWLCLKKLDTHWLHSNNLREGLVWKIFSNSECNTYKLSTNKLCNLISKNKMDIETIITNNTEAFIQLS